MKEIEEIKKLISSYEGGFLSDREFLSLLIKETEKGWKKEEHPTLQVIISLMIAAEDDPDWYPSAAFFVRDVIRSIRSSL